MILVTGGTRCGKSEYAEKLVEAMGEHYLYLATAKITDYEMEKRVLKHQERRSTRWDTHEGYLDLEQVILNDAPEYDGVLLDCATTMTTNMLFDLIGEVDYDTFDYSTVDYRGIELKILEAFEQLCQAALRVDAKLVVVTGEIGLGVVPDSYLGRAFRDIAGRVNQLLARYSDQVYFVVSGIPMKIKG